MTSSLSHTFPHLAEHFSNITVPGNYLPLSLVTNYLYHYEETHRYELKHIKCCKNES